MKEEKKEFKFQKDGSLKVFVSSEDDLFLPGSNNSKVVIGKVTQKTVQHIPVDKINSLKAYVKTQMESSEAQIDSVKTNLAKLKGVDEKFVPEKLMNKLMKYLTDAKGKAKPIKKHLKELNLFMGQARQKVQLKMQLEYLEGHLKMIKKDYDKLNGN